MSVNCVAISGNLTRDAELRDAGGTSLLRFTVAVGDSRKVNGRWEKCAHFIDCIMWGTRADKLARYLTKGTKVSVQGKLVYSQWEKDGQKRSRVEVRVSEIDFTTRERQNPAPYPDEVVPYIDETPGWCV